MFGSMNMGDPLRAAAILFAATLSSAQTAPAPYAQGQVWEYHARPQDAGSLLKIQRVTTLGNEKVYHLSVIGIHFKKANIRGVLPDIPVSGDALDASVTKLSSSKQTFPPVSKTDEGIVEWRRAKGGVFTLPVAQIVDSIDSNVSSGEPGR